MEVEELESMRSIDSSLDISTQLGTQFDELEQDSGWKLTSYPECSEASLVWIAKGPSIALGQERRWTPVDLSDFSEDGEPQIWWVSDEGKVARAKPGRGLDFVAEADAYTAIRQAQKWRQSNGRAASTSRRYFVRNALRFMWVLTFRDAQFDRRRIMGDVAELTRRLRRVLGSDVFPYWYSPELHPGGHGWHVNLFVPMWIPHGLMEEAWGHGFVWVTDFAKSSKGPKGEPLGLCRSDREGWRRAAHYGCKYAQKDWSHEHVGRSNHRYEVAQGFAPIKETLWVGSEAEAEAWIADQVAPGARGEIQRWNSNEVEDWNRPPVRTWRW